VFRVAWAPDGTLLASADGAGVVRLWDTQKGQLRQSFGEADDDAGFDALAFSPDGRRLAYGGGPQGEIFVRDLTGGEPTRTLLGARLINDLAFSPEGDRLLSADSDGMLRFWDPALGQEVFRLRSQGRSALTVAFSPDGLRLASGWDDGTVRIWDAPRDEPR
jgi:WD40 repeat protein